MRPFCQSCDHGIINGKICDVCHGTGYEERRKELKELCKECHKPSGSIVHISLALRQGFEYHPFKK